MDERSSQYPVRFLLAYAALAPLIFGVLPAGYYTRALVGLGAAVPLAAALATRAGERRWLGAVPLGWLVGIVGWMLPQFL